MSQHPGHHSVPLMVVLESTVHVYTILNPSCPRRRLHCGPANEMVTVHPHGTPGAPEDRYFSAVITLSSAVDLPVHRDV